MPSVKYPFPEFLRDQCSEAAYRRWLTRKTGALVRRDRARGNSKATVEAYKLAIHAAVRKSDGLDGYTGQRLHWNLISRFEDEAAKQGRREYKKSFGDLPTVDHVGDGLGAPEFVICSWRTNDSKNDLTYEEFINFCRSVLKYHDYQQKPVG